jgi:hypothetical protein
MITGLIQGYDSRNQPMVIPVLAIALHITEIGDPG